jgi:HK97 family phage portal protein
MNFLSRLWSSPAAPAPRASLQSAGGGTLIVSPQQLEEALRGGSISAAGESVTPETAMRVAAVFGCVRIRCTGPATLPIDINRRVDERTRVAVPNHDVGRLLRRRPNRWMKPHQFKRMLQAQVLLEGNGYALKIPGALGNIQSLIPMNPRRVKTKQLDDLSIVHDWTRKNGSVVRLHQDEVFHLFGLTLDGITGVTPLTYARETVGTALAQDRYLGRTLARGARVSGAAQTKEKLSDKAYNRLKESLEEFRAGEDREGDFLLLEEGLEWKPMSLTMVDMEWIESQKLGRSSVCMFYGVPPSMIGDNSGSDSNWGTGLEQKKQGFLSFTAEDDLVMWEEGIDVDLIGDSDPDVYARFNRSAFVRGDLKTRYGSYREGRNGGWLSKNDIRTLEDMNPIEGGDGDDYDAPLNSNAAATKDDPDEDTPSSRER